MTYNPIPTAPHYNTAPASRDAKSCVSRAMIAIFILLIITHEICIYPL